MSSELMAAKTILVDGKRVQKLTIQEADKLAVTKGWLSHYEIAGIFGVSHTHIQNIERQAMAKIRTAIQDWKD